MSTRGLYTFIDDAGQYHVYVHSDNYPDGEYGGVAKINAALKKAWDLPRFEADEFAASFVATTKENQGGVRLTVGESWQQAASCDIEYHYTVSAIEGVLWVNVDSVNCPDWNKPKRWTEELLCRGPLSMVHHWAMNGCKPIGTVTKSGKPTIVAVARAGDHRTGSLPSTVTPAQIKKILGFAANIDDDKDKVKYSWGFEVDGKYAAIWDYKGSRWSTFDPANVLPALFASK